MPFSGRVSRFAEFSFLISFILFTLFIFLGHYKQIHDIVKDVVLFTKDLNLKPIAYLGLRLNAEISF